MYTLHYSKLNSDTIEDLKFKNHAQMVDFIDKTGFRRPEKVVYLIANDSLIENFISEKYTTIQFFLNKMPLWNTVGTYYLFEFESYEEAYKVGLSMLEPNPLCYEI